MNNQTPDDRRCLIVGAGSFDLRRFETAERDYVIAVDGGYSHLAKLGIMPDMLLGDFDSLPDVPAHPNIIRHKPEKDDTDMMLAVKTALELGFREFHIYGALGGRLDHTQANLQTLAYLAETGAKGYLIGEGIVATALQNGRLSFQKDCAGYISVFCHSEQSIGVYERGLKYSLTDATLFSTMPRGVSNEFLGREAFVSVREGTLIVMWERKIHAPADSLGILDKK
ncbi:MAG: thiamine diphosphokinase [Oscillospiraceae bacterium]|jgi:thiamine pyrophosphokinase|nr:thiamine diphosphokinase [Oscillospiraceae bacterium]